MTLTASDTEKRRGFADAMTHFNEQRSWYSDRATELKRRAQRSDLLVIGAGALVAAISAAAAASAWGSYLVAALGVLIAVVQGAQRVFRSAEIWPGYRMAAEAMKSEYRMFIYGGGVYATPFDEASATYLVRLETLLANERHSYFEDLKTARSNNHSAASAPASDSAS